MKKRKKQRKKEKGGRVAATMRDDTYNYREGIKTKTEGYTQRHGQIES